MHSIKGIKQWNKNFTTIINIDLNEKFIALSTDKLSYYYFSENWLNSCSLQTPEIICKPPVELKSVTLEPTCETSIYNQVISKSCKIQIISNTKSQWIPLASENSWLYIMQPNQKIQLRCIKESEILFNISQTGKLEINQDFKIIQPSNNSQKQILFSSKQQNISLYLPTTGPISEYIAQFFEDKQNFSENICKEYILKQKEIFITDLEICILLKENQIKTQHSQNSFALIFTYLINAILSIITFRIFMTVKGIKVDEFSYWHSHLTTFVDNKLYIQPGTENIQPRLTHYITNRNRPLPTIIEEVF